MTTALAPILAFTCDEVWRSMGNTENVHLAEFAKMEEATEEEVDAENY